MPGTTKSLADTSKLVQNAELDFRMIPLDRLRVFKELFLGKDSSPGRDPGIGTVMLPLVVAPTGKTGRTFTVIDGYKRLISLKINKRGRAPCAVLKAALDKKALGLLRIQLNQGRAWGLGEKILMLRWLVKNFDNAKAESIAQTAGISKQEIVQLAPLLNARKPVIDAFANGKLQLPVLRTFMLMRASDQDAFLKTFSHAGLSLQTQREFLEWLTEIAYVEHKSVAAVLEDSVADKALTNQRLNWPQRIEKLRGILFARRFPHLSQAEKRWKDEARKVNPSEKRIRFIPSPFLEKDRLEVRISLTDPGEAPGLFRKLSQVTEEQWQRIVCPFRG